jgi:protein SHQ1
LTEEESKALYGIKHLEFLMSQKMAFRSFLSLAEIVMSTTYDTLIFGFDGSCESHWTICKLSATLSWFDLPESAKDVVLTGLRRILVYPVYRSYGFAKICWQQTVELFNEGKTAVLKCLLRAVVMISRGEHRWRLNKLYLEPMICWLQDLNESEFRRWSDELRDAVEGFPEREDVCEEWCIELLEQCAEKQKGDSN